MPVWVISTLSEDNVPRVAGPYFSEDVAREAARRWEDTTGGVCRVVTLTAPDELVREMRSYEEDKAKAQRWGAPAVDGPGAVAERTTADSGRVRQRKRGRKDRARARAVQPPAAEPGSDSAGERT